MDRKYRLGFSWLAAVLCMALLMTSMPIMPAYAKSKKDTYFTIKWKVDGKTVKKDKVKKGEKPEKPEDPADYSEGKYTYVFKGWEPKVTKATKDMTYNAKFKKTARTVTITWLDDEGKLIDFTQVKYGKMPTHDDPKKKATKKSTFVFDGWEPKLVKATEDATYTATFQKKARKYKITWLDDKGNVIDQTKVAYGELPEHEDPVRESGKYTYTFTGWEPALTKVTGDATYTATFEKGEKKAGKYTITWMDDAGNVIDTTQVKAGKKPTHDDPTKEPTEQYTYVFKGWEPKLVEATEDATYTATFKQKTRKYTITWMDDEGSVIDETKVPYGEMPTHDDLSLPESEFYTYIFKGWEPELAPVTGDATYTAVFEEIPKPTAEPEQTPEATPEQTAEPEQTPEATPEQTTEVTPEQQPEQTPEQPAVFTIFWLDDAGNVIDTTTAQAGEVPSHDALTKEATDQYTYTFTGWTPEPVAATADAAYTATFSQALRSYAITWLDDGDNVIDTTLVAYGEMPAHDDPVKASTELATYTFAGWEPELAPVTGDATYKATFTETLVSTEDIPLEIVEPALAEGEVTIKFLDSDGNTLDEEKYEVTEPAKQVYYEGTAPTREGDNDKGYKWVGWKDETGSAHYGKSTNESDYTEQRPLLPAATAEATYIAEFDEVPKYTVKFVNKYDGAAETVLQESKVEAGTKPEYTGDTPTRPNDEQYVYTFDGWLAEGGETPIQTADLPEVTGEATYTAHYTPATKITLTFAYGYENKDDPKFIEGAVNTDVDQSRVPTYARDGYTFAGWDTDIPKTFEANVIITALWLKSDSLELADVNCYAYRPAIADALKLLLSSKTVTLGDGTTTAEAALTWSADKCDPSFTDAAKDDSGDGPYTFTGTLTAQDANKVNYTTPVTCKLIVGPKTSETVGADKTANKNYEYRWDIPVETGDAKAKATITKWSGADIKEEIPQTLAIPSVIDGRTVIGIGANAFKEKKLSEISVPAGVTTIGDGAFASCANLTKLTLPDTLSSIGKDITKGTPLLDPTQSTQQVLTVGLETTLKADANGIYSICHKPDAAKGETKYGETELTKPANLPSGMPSDLSITAGAVLTLATDFTVYKGHSATGVDANTVVSNPGKLYAEIDWLNDDDSLFDMTFVEYGKTPTHTGPTKAATEKNTFTFAGWSPAIVAVSDPATYKATFTQADRLYTLRFVDEDGRKELWKKEDYKYEDLPRYGGNAPTKAEDNQYTYTFAGWVDTKDTKEQKTVYASDNLPKVTADATYKATYNQADRLYVISFVDEDGTTKLREDREYKYEEIPKFDDEGKTPTKTGYIFLGWLDSGDNLYKPDDKLPKVTANATYKASFQVANVNLKVTYSGPTLTKEYDLTKNVFKRTSSGGYTYAITAPKAADFKLEPVSGSSWIEGHKDVELNVASIKSVEQFPSADVGAYSLKFTFGLKGADASYYTAKSVTIPAKITPRSVEITPRAGLSKVYGTKDPSYPDGSWLSSDESSPLHQNLSGVPGYGVPVNTVDGKLTLTVTNQQYLLAEAKLKGTKFFPNDGWLDRQSGEDVGKYKITMGKMDFGSNFKSTLKEDFFTIVAKNLGDANITVDAIGNQKYTGKPIEPNLTVRYGNMTLNKDTDFTVKFTDNTEVSTDGKKAKATLTGKGNFTGTKEVTFNIIRTADPSVSPTTSPTTRPGGGGGGGSSSSGFGYDGFDDEDEGDAESDSIADGLKGVLKLNDEEYGTVLFGNDGKPRPFELFEEEIEPETEDEMVEFGDDMMDNISDETAIEIEDMPEESNQPRRLTIVPEPMKIPATEEDGEDTDVLLEGTDRLRYEELHLRLTTTEVQALLNNNVSEIVYELEKAQLVLPLSVLTSAIKLSGAGANEEEVFLSDETESDFEVDDEIEIEDAIEVEDENGSGIEMDEVGIPFGKDDEVQTMPVDGYDIVIEQADATGLTAREQALIADYQTLMPAYRVRVSVIPAGAEQVPTGEMDEDEQPITIPVTQPLPEGCTLPGVVLKLEPNDSYLAAPEEAQVLYASIVPEGETPDGETPVDPLAGDDASMTKAVFDEEDDPIKVIVTPVVDGLYVAVAPSDWDPTPYLPDVTDEEDTTIDSNEADEEEVDFEVEVDDEEVDFEDDTGDEETVNF